MERIIIKNRFKQVWNQIKLDINLGHLFLNNPINNNNLNKIITQNQLKKGVIIEEIGGFEGVILNVFSKLSKVQFKV